MHELEIKYGCNPHQKPAKVYNKNGKLPITLINGSPSYINFADALNSWQLVKELSEATGLPAAASFKHVSPAGAAVGIPLNDTLKKAYRIENQNLSPVAAAYARARGADRLSSFGDFVAISHKVDIDTANILKTEVSDGIIAPGYEDDALEVLKSKKRGTYVIMSMDKDYSPIEMETREIFGVTIEQMRNNAVITKDSFNDIVTENKNITPDAIRDLLIATITLKYTQSNSVCFAYDGQVIGCGAGQQSRVHCTRLAAEKADNWVLRQHPRVISMQFKEGLKNPTKDNAIDLYLRDDITQAELKEWETLFDQVPKKLTIQEKAQWIESFGDISFSSDAFFPFRDSIDRAAASGVKYVAQPGGSIRDQEVTDACNTYGMAMCFTGLRLFHH